MKKIWRILAISGLALIILPNLFLLKGMITPLDSYTLIAIGLVLWLVARFFYRRG